MAKFLFLLVFGLGALVLHVNTLRYGAMPEFLHSSYEHNHGVRRPQIITRERENYDDEPKVTSPLHRHRRDTVTGKEDSGPDIKPRVSSSFCSFPECYQLASFLFVPLILIKAIEMRAPGLADRLSHKGILSLSEFWFYNASNDLLLCDDKSAVPCSICMRVVIVFCLRKEQSELITCFRTFMKHFALVWKGEMECSIRRVDMGVVDGFVKHWIYKGSLIMMRI